MEGLVLSVDADRLEGGICCCGGLTCLREFGADDCCGFGDGESGIVSKKIELQGWETFYLTILMAFGTRRCPLEGAIFLWFQYRIVEDRG